MGGKPLKSTPKDMRLTRNKPQPQVKPVVAANKNNRPPVVNRAATLRNPKK